MIRHYLSQQSLSPPSACAIGIANPISGDTVSMTNRDWSFSIVALQRALNLERLVVVNDFTALALSLPSLSIGDLIQIGPGQAQTGAPLALLGPGTGLGVSGLFALGKHPYAITGEGGHVSLPAANQFEASVVQALHRRFGHASAERALSGPGLVNLYAAVCELAGEPVRVLTPADVVANAGESGDPHCMSALTLFFSFLGSVAGNLALTLGARGGVYIGGGIVPCLIGEINRSSFRERFESKGRFAGYLQTIPTYVIDASISPALLGAARALENADLG
jgi:glucokinase